MPTFVCFNLSIKVRHREHKEEERIAAEEKAKKEEEKKQKEAKKDEDKKQKAVKNKNVELSSESKEGKMKYQVLCKAR